MTSGSRCELVATLSGAAFGAVCNERIRFSDGGVMRNRVRATRLAAGAFVSVAVIGLAAGCSGSDEAAPATFPPAAEGRDVDALVEALRGDDNEIADADYVCAADSLINVVSDQGYEQLIAGSTDPTVFEAMSEGDRTAFEAGLDACVSAESRVSLFDSILRPEGGTTLSDESLQCVTVAVSEEFGGFGALMTGMATPSGAPVFASALVSSYSSCEVAGGIGSFVVSMLTATGFDPVAAQCVVDQFPDDEAGHLLLAQGILQDPIAAEQFEAAAATCLSS